MADWVQEISDRAKQGLEIAAEAVTDKDKLNELKYRLAETAINALYTGKGSSVTKIVSVVLVAIITLAALTKWIMDGGSLYEVFIGPGMLITGYGAGKIIPRVAEKKYGNGNNRVPTAPSYRRPEYGQPDNEPDNRPSGTKRDHPGGH